MALNAGTVWESRPAAGSANNGGGFVACKYVSAIALNAGGSGYAVGNVLTVSGGTSLGVASTITVDTVDGSGAVLTAHVTETGGYTTDPANPVSVTGGAGAGAKFDLTLTATTDYSIQNAAQATWLSSGGTYTNDLTGTNAANSVLTSVAGAAAFVGAIVGNIIKITAGTNYNATLKYHQIISVQVGVNATVESIATNGTGALSGGSAYLGGATDSIDTIFSTTVAGNKIWFKNTGTADTITNNRACSAGSAIASIVYEGYNTTRGDLYGETYVQSHNANGFLTRTGHPSIVWTGNFILTFGSNSKIRCLTISGGCTSQTTIQAGTASVVYRCKITSTANNSSAIAAGGSTNTIFIDSEFDTTGAASDRSLAPGTVGTVIGCRITSTAGNGLSVSSTVLIVDTLFYNIASGKTAVAASTADLNTFLYRCTIDNCGTGISLPNSAQTRPMLNVSNCIFTRCTTAMTNLRSASQVVDVFGGNNVFIGCTNTYVGFQQTSLPGDYVNGAGVVGDEFVDAATQDYRLISTSHAKAAGYVPGSDCGWLQRVEPTYPAAAKVLDDAGTYGDTISPTTPTYHAPDAAEVISTAVFGPSSGISGTVVQPAESTVWYGTTYGPGSSLTGAMRASDIPNCTAENIKDGEVIDDVTGTLVCSAGRVVLIG